MSINLVEGERYLLAVDPGETSGWAVFSPEGQPLGFGQVRGREALYDLLQEIGPVKVVVCEDYRLFGHKAIQQSGSKMETVRVIGAIDSWAHQFGVKPFMQPSSIKSIAVKWSGLKPIGSHDNSHHVDAYNHGYYYLQKNGIIKPVKR